MVSIGPVLVIVFKLLFSSPGQKTRKNLLTTKNCFIFCNLKNRKYDVFSKYLLIVFFFLGGGGGGGGLFSKIIIQACKIIKNKTLNIKNYI